MNWKQEITDWVRQGILPNPNDSIAAAQFIAILQNDLATVLSYGYTDRVGEWAEDVLLLVPPAARGSVEAVRKWRAQGGMEGLNHDSAD